MSEHFDLVLRSGTVMTPSGAAAVEVGGRDGRAASLGTPRAAGTGVAGESAAETIDCVLHVTTGEGMVILAAHEDIATAEVTPNHLSMVAPECYETLGSLAQMPPPVRDEAHREALWEAVRSGALDVVGSGHAAHTPEEKQADDPASPSGMPGVQTLVPPLLGHVHAGRPTLERFVDLTSAGPRRIHGIEGTGRIALGCEADFTVVGLAVRRRIGNASTRSRCGWTPYDGREVTGWPIAPIVRGACVMREDELLGEPPGTPVRFIECLPPEGTGPGNASTLS